MSSTGYESYSERELDMADSMSGAGGMSSTLIQIERNRRSGGFIPQGKSNTLEGCPCCNCKTTKDNPKKKAKKK